MRKLLLVVFAVALVCSCGTQSGVRDSTSSSGGTTRETGPPQRVTTVADGQAGEQTTEPATPPARVNGPASRNTPSRPAVGANGMVSSAHPLATRAGLEILEKGGNAFDASVAVAAALNVVEPMMSGIGGYGAIVLYDAESGQTRFLEVDSRAPAGLDPSVFRPPTPGYLENRCGAMVVVAPGNLNAWEAMWEEYGALEWESLFEPAIEHAEDGFVIGEEMAGWLGSEYSAFPEHAQDIYGRDGAPLTQGERLVQRDLAGSLRRVAEEGAEAVYGGEIGQAIVSEVQRGGGSLTIEDLRDNRSRWRETLGIDYRGYRVVTASPPATSWGALARLGIAAQFGLEPSDHNSVTYVHALTEISKRAFSQAQVYVDPETGETRLDLVLSEEYWEEQAAQIDFSRASPYEPPIKVDTARSCSPTNYTPTTAGTQQHTTHFVVADREGNVVSSTQTLGNVFGSKVMPEGTGIWLNDSLAWARFEPAGNAFDAAPGRQLPYALSPVVVMRDGQPRIAIGTPGGRTILQTTPQMLANVIDFDMDIQRAVAAPRFSFVVPNLLLLEESIPADVRGELSAMGHNVYAEPEIGNAHALTVEYGPGGRPARFTGAADPRGEGAAIGY